MVARLGSTRVELPDGDGWQGFGRAAEGELVIVSDEIGLDGDRPAGDGEHQGPAMVDPDDADHRMDPEL
jgi:hypothetical protein